MDVKTLLQKLQQFVAEYPDGADIPVRMYDETQPLGLQVTLVHYSGMEHSLVLSGDD